MKHIKRVFAAVFAVLLLTTTVRAAGTENYIYNEKGLPKPAPSPAEAVYSLRGEDLGIGAFNEPRDLCFSAGGTLYIADSKNNRIVLISNIDKADQSVSIINKFTDGEKEDTFNNPCGVFADDENNLFVADTGNARIVKLDENGGLVQIINAPEANVLPDGFIFKPVKLALDAYNQMYVISEGYNAGLMEFEPSGKYTQSMGAPRVAVSLVDQFWRRFSTKAQRERSQSFVPTEYSNIAIDNEGFLFVTTSAYDAEQYRSNVLKPLRKLNARGTDVFNRVGDPVGDNFEKGETYKGPSAFSDVCTLNYGDFALLDQKRGRVFAYNSVGELLYEFGGPLNVADGIRAGAALAYRDEKYYILDSGKHRIAVFELTEYGKLFDKVAKARNEIDFESEEALWNEILNRNANCVMALRGLGNAAYKSKNMREAMRYYKLAKDRAEYSKAYAFVRRSGIENNVLILCAVLAAAAAVVVIILRSKKRISAFVSRRPTLKAVAYAAHVSTHPIDGFWDLKREKRGNALSATILLIICVAVSVLSSLGTGFIFNRTDIESYSIFSVLYILAALGLWVICQWCVTSLMYGEGKLRDIYISACYATAPYSLLTVLSVIISRGLLSNEGDFYYLIISLSVLWMAILLIFSVKQIHDFSMSRTLASILITIIVILLIVFIGMLVIALSQQLFSFIGDMASEIRLRI